jgi:hypothetical protein
MHATRLLGQDILNAMTSEAMGDLVGENVKHEGIVIRHPEFSPHPFKITGEFIVAGMHGNFAKVMGNKVTITELYLRRLISESIKRVLSIF